MQQVPDPLRVGDSVVEGIAQWRTVCSWWEFFRGNVDMID